MELLPARPAIRLFEPDDHKLVRTAIGSSGEAIRLWVPTGALATVLAYTDSTTGAKFPVTQATASCTGRISIATATDEFVFDIPKLNTAFPLIQQLPNQRILIAGSRCTREVNGREELNAKIYRFDGSLEREFCMGDGIQDIQANPSGDMWVSYFDEGVFGNFGWGFRGDDSGPIGASGLVCFDSYGRKKWEFEPASGFNSIADCYALNVASDAVWSCYYTDFPIARISLDRQVTAWNTTLSGPRSLAVSGNMILAYGGYAGYRTDCQLLKLGVDSAEEITKVILKVPAKVSLEECEVIGRGQWLHAFANNNWWSFQVPQHSAVR